MDEYKKPCFILWNGCAEAIEALGKQNFGEAEDCYIAEAEE